MIYSLAPIQGITDFRFRKCFHTFFGGIDKFYAPYIRLEKSMQIPRSRIRDLDPGNNLDLDLIPQFMSNQAKEVLFLADYLADLGYAEMNWNLGCPFPMVTNRQMGAGLLPHPDRIDQILEEVCPRIKIKLSVKTRLGLEDPKDLERLIPILNRYPLEEIIIHPRIGKQLYKGFADRDLFEAILPKIDHPVGYNGDIRSSEEINECQNRFQNVKQWMIGRSLIANPFLVEDFLGAPKSNESKLDRFEQFHMLLVEEYLSALSGPSHLLTKMKAFWEYFSLSFSNSHKVFKRIKKANSLDKFNLAVETNFKQETWET